jgi:hypothetical protein
MMNSEQPASTEQSKIEELRKLSPATAYRLYEIIEGAGESRKEDHETMERLASNMREDIQKTLGETMRSVVVLVESLRTDIRKQDCRIDQLEDDVRSIKEHIGIAI